MRDFVTRALRCASHAAAVAASNARGGARRSIARVRCASTAASASTVRRDAAARVTIEGVSERVLRFDHVGACGRRDYYNAVAAGVGNADVINVVRGRGAGRDA